MLWVLSLHIISLSVWSASILYVSAILLAVANGQTKRLTHVAQAHTKVLRTEQHDAAFTHTPEGLGSIARFVFTHLAAPAAIISIGAGTAVFLINQSHDFWLLAKLTLVTLLCIAQASMGIIIVRAERGEFKWMRAMCRGLLLVLSLLMLAIVWIVLSKPTTPDWVQQWF